MNKAEFLSELEARLQGLPTDAISDRVEFYSEMIDDLVEDGISEEKAVAEIGDIDNIVKEIIADTPITRIIREKVRSKKRLKWWELTLIIVGFPVWFSLLAACFAVVIAVFVSLWAAVISLWSVFASFVGCVLGGLVFGVSSFCNGEIWSGVASLGIAVASVGFSIFSFYGCKAVTKGWAWLTKKAFIGLKKAFVKKEAI